MKDWRKQVAGHDLARIVVGLFVILTTASLIGQTASAATPRVLGIAHIAVHENNLGKAVAFYRDFLGFAQPFSLKQPDGTEWLSFIKVNDQQYVELFAATPPNGGHLNHFALYTDDAARMRTYLRSRGVSMLDEIHNGKTGDRFFTIRDPDGHLIEIVEYQSNSWSAQSNGNFMPASRAATRISHVGILVGSVAPALSFYRDILGLRETWRSSPNNAPNNPTWIDLAVPDGTDYVELVLDPNPPSPTQHKLQNHISLESTDVQKVVGELQSRAAGNAYTNPITVELSRDHRLQMNLFDPDGTRIEIMEPRVIDVKQVAGQGASSPR